MIKVYCIFTLLFCCLINIFGQQEKHNDIQDSSFETFRGNKESRLSKGTCIEVIKALKVAFENDSVAIETFKEEYEITNMSISGVKWLRKQNSGDIIKFFHLKENSYYYCRSKIFKFTGPTLLVN